MAQGFRPCIRVRKARGSMRHTLITQGLVSGAGERRRVSSAYGNMSNPTVHPMYFTAMYDSHWCYTCRKASERHPWVFADVRLKRPFFGVKNKGAILCMVQTYDRSLSLLLVHCLWPITSTFPSSIRSRYCAVFHPLALGPSVFTKAPPLPPGTFPVLDF